MIARRHNRDWYLGAMTDWTARELQIDFSFPPTGTWQLQEYQDGPNADRVGGDYKRLTSVVKNNTKLWIKLAGGGGWVARIRLQNR